MLWKTDAEPVIPLIKLEKGSALDFIRQIQQAVGNEESSPIVVAVPASSLNSRRNLSVEVRDITLGAAMKMLTKITNLRTTKRGKDWWIEGVDWPETNLLTRTYRFSPETMRAIGLEFDPEAEGTVRRGGRVWPFKKGTVASYIPAQSTFVVRATEEEIAGLDAILLLRQRGYEVTLRK